MSKSAFILNQVSEFSIFALLNPNYSLGNPCLPIKLQSSRYYEANLLQIRNKVKRF
jgi:hypothetical protein